MSKHEWVLCCNQCNQDFCRWCHVDCDYGRLDEQEDEECPDAPEDEEKGEEVT